MIYKTTILLLTLTLMSFQLMAEGQWYPGLAKLYDSDVVVEATYVRQNNEHFWIKINVVLRGEQYGLKQGDYLRVINTKNGSCGFGFDIKDYKIARFYLEKHKETWQLINNSNVGLDHIKIDSDSTYFYFGTKSFDYLRTDFNEDLIEFQTCYKMYSEGWGFYTSKPDEFIIKKTKTNRLIKHFEEIFRNVHDLQFMNNRLANMFDAGTNVHRMVWTVDQLPLFDGGRSNAELLSYLSTNVKFPIDDKTEQHTAFVSLLILEDGSIGEVEFPYSSHSSENEQARFVIEQMPKWKPAQFNGENVSCWLTIPVYLNQL